MCKFFIAQYRCHQMRWKVMEFVLEQIHVVHNELHTVSGKWFYSCKHPKAYNDNYQERILGFSSPLSYLC